MYSIAPTSKPCVGCTAIEIGRKVADLPGDDRLLLVAAGHAARYRCAALTGADIKPLDQFVCVASNGVKTDEPVILVFFDR